MAIPVVLADLADELGRDKSTVRKTAIKLGLSCLRVRPAMGQHGQAVLALSPQDAAKLREWYGSPIVEVQGLACSACRKRALFQREGRVYCGGCLTTILVSEGLITRVGQ